MQEFNALLFDVVSIGVNFFRNRNPLPTDDISMGFQVEQTWLSIQDDSNLLFICERNALGNAFWKLNKTFPKSLPVKFVTADSQNFSKELVDGETTISIPNEFVTLLVFVDGIKLPADTYTITGQNLLLLIPVYDGNLLECVLL